MVTRILLVLAAALALAACNSPNVPERYRSQAWPGGVDCTAFPEPPAPASCRNLYDGAIHPHISLSFRAP